MPESERQYLRKDSGGKKEGEYAARTHSPSGREKAGGKGGGPPCPVRPCYLWKPFAFSDAQFRSRLAWHLRQT
jgi:hypothetical protein